MFKTTEQSQRRKIAEYLVVAVVIVGIGLYQGADPVIYWTAAIVLLTGAWRHRVKLRQLQRSIQVDRAREESER